MSTAVDGGDRAYAPYAFPVADTCADVAWEDGDSDPIALDAFYYFDHAPPLALSITDIIARGTRIPGIGDIWAACSCTPDIGVVCPDAGVRNCPSGFTWSTSSLAPGAYWVVATTSDPPYDIYTVSAGPIRVAHGGALPPAVIVLRPDGFGTYDRSYETRFMFTGQAPFHVDLS